MGHCARVRLISPPFRFGIGLNFAMVYEKKLSIKIKNEIYFRCPLVALTYNKLNAKTSKILLLCNLIKITDMAHFLAWLNIRIFCNPFLGWKYLKTYHIYSPFEFIMQIT